MIATRNRILCEWLTEDNETVEMVALVPLRFYTEMRDMCGASGHRFLI